MENDKLALVRNKKNSILFSQLDFGQRFIFIVCPEFGQFRVVSVTLPCLAGDKGLDGNTDH